MAKFSTIVLSSLLALAGCDAISEIANDEEWYFNDEEDCNCNNSYIHLGDNDDEPESGDAVLWVSDDMGDVKISVYDGTLDGKLMTDSITSRERNTFALPLNRTYTYSAQYVKNGDTIIVPVKSYLECKIKECNGLQCYFLYNNIIDLRLRY